jgi:hypothetical protein
MGGRSVRPPLLFSQIFRDFLMQSPATTRFGAASHCACLLAVSSLLVDMAPKHLWPILIIVSAAVALYFLYLATIARSP